MISAVLCAMLFAAAPPSGSSIEVTAVAFRNAEGGALFFLYGSEETWLDRDEAVRKGVAKIAQGRAVVVFENIPPGTYAVSVIHDENRNGKLDMRWFPIPGPAEGAAVSNDAEAFLGPPSFEDSAFAHREARKMKVRVRY